MTFRAFGASRIRMAAKEPASSAPTERIVSVPKGGHRKFTERYEGPHVGHFGGSDRDWFCVSDWCPRRHFSEWRLRCRPRGSQRCTCPHIGRAFVWGMHDRLRRNRHPRPAWRPSIFRSRERTNGMHCRPTLLRRIRFKRSGRRRRNLHLRRSGRFRRGNGQAR